MKLKSIKPFWIKEINQKSESKKCFEVLLNINIVTKRDKKTTHNGGLQKLGF